jgi:hypothetical protein
MPQSNICRQRWSARECRNYLNELLANMLAYSKFVTREAKSFIALAGDSVDAICKLLHWRHDHQYNDIQHNDTQHNDTQHNEIQYNNIQHNDIQHNDNHH